MYLNYAVDICVFDKPNTLLHNWQHLTLICNDDAMASGWLRSVEQGNHQKLAFQFFPD